MGEETLALHFSVHQIEVEREYRFDPVRKWRFDFAIPVKKIAIEVEGGTWTSGRHNRGTGYEKDLCKYNAAARQGWLVLRYTTRMVTSGEAIDEVVGILGEV